MPAIRMPINLNNRTLRKTLQFLFLLQTLLRQQFLHKLRPTEMIYSIQMIRPLPPIICKGGQEMTSYLTINHDCHF